MRLGKWQVFCERVIVMLVYLIFIYIYKKIIYILLLYTSV